MPSDIILIGPIRAGKTTLGELLAEKLGMPQVSMDDKCWGYYQELRDSGDLTNDHGPDGMFSSYYKLHALERLLQTHRECVIDLGAGHSVFPDSASLERAKTLLEPYPNVILLLPSPDLDESARVLAERNFNNDWLKGFMHKNGVNPNEHFLRHQSNFVLSKHVLYTNRKSPSETCIEILNRIEEPN